MMTVTAGVIGLGVMGGSIAGRIVASGFDTEVYDLNPATVERLVAAGARAGTIESIAARDVVVLSLPNDAIVASVGGQLTGHLGADTALIEMSTILPQTARQLRDMLHAAEFVDAPISGGPDDASNGSLGILVGVDAPLSDGVRSVLDVLGAISEVGEVGEGKAVKLINNMMSMGNVAVAAEAFQLGVKLGLDPQRLYDVLSVSGGRSNHFNKRMPWAIAEDFIARFAVRLGEKDLRLAIQLAHDNTFPLPVTALVHQVYEEASAKGFADEDLIALTKLYR